MESILALFLTFVPGSALDPAFAARQADPQMDRSLTPIPGADMSAHAPRLRDLLRRAGGFTIPAAWAGVWEFDDIDYDCATNDSLDSDSSTDTLCTGDPVFPDSGLTCTGNADDNNINIVCEGTFEIITGCFATFTNTLVASRNGDSLTATLTFSRSYTPPNCIFKEDSCTRTESSGSRIGPEPPGCTTAVEEVSWGKVKARYK
jgi:hypothetical protein